MASRGSNLVLLSGVIRVRSHASPFVVLCSQPSMNSYDESAGAIGMSCNAIRTRGRNVYKTSSKNLLKL